MFNNELAFYDSLTVDNYLSMVVREYVAYRLYKPYKIKERLVLLSSAKSIAIMKESSTLANLGQNSFILSFPTMKIYKEGVDIKVVTKTELFSVRKNEIVLSEENVGLAKGGLTDYPMCSGDNWDCAMVNSVYPSLVKVVKLIADSSFGVH